MQGRSHLIIGLAAGVAVDSVFQLSGEPWIGSSVITGSELIGKAVYYVAVGIGALLPDIDHSESIMGKRFGVISEFIHKTIGHRTLFHSLLGLVLAAMLALGFGQLIQWLLGSMGLFVSTSVGGIWNIFLLGILAGSIIHILCDALTTSGVPLFWPRKFRFGLPPNRELRFKTGAWQEFAITGLVVVLVVVGVFTSVLRI